MHVNVCLFYCQIVNKYELPVSLRDALRARIGACGFINFTDEEMKAFMQSNMDVSNVYQAL